MGTIHKNVKEIIELLSMLPEDLPVGGEDWDEGIGIELYYDQAKTLSSLQFLDLNNVHQDDEDWRTWRRCGRPRGSSEADAITKDQALDWIEESKQAIEIRYDESEGWIIEDLIDGRYVGKTLLDAVRKAKDWKSTVERYGKKETRTCFHCGAIFTRVYPPGPPDIPPYSCDAEECRAVRTERLRREVG